MGLPVQLTATEMAEMIHRKRISPRELVQAHLDRIEQLNPQLNALVSIDRDGVLKQARAAEARVMRGD